MMNSIRSFLSDKKKYQYGVLFVSFLLILVGLSFAAPPTRQLSELPENDYGTDTIYTMIRNSNGKYYSPSGANLQAAIWDLNGTTGEVVVPAGYYDIDFLNISDKVTVIGAGNLGNEDGHTGKGGTQFNLTEDTDTIMLSGGRLWNSKIYCTLDFDGVAVNVTPIGEDTGYFNNEYEHVTNVLKDVNILRYNQNLGEGQESGIGLMLYCDNVSSQHIGMAAGFNDVTIMGFEYGLYMDAVGTSWNNGNIFSNLAFRSCKYCIYILNGGGNVFDNIQIQPDLEVTEEAFHIESNINMFSNVMIWDWVPASMEASINVSGNGNQFSGWLRIDDVNDTGEYNKFDVVSYESNYFVYYPSNHMDGTKINTNLGCLGPGEPAVMVFMPGTYDIDVTVSSITREIEYIFTSGVNFIARAGFSTTYMMKLLENETIHGPGVLDGNDVSGIYGMRVYGENVSVSDITIRDAAYGMRVDCKYGDFYDCRMYECDTGFYITEANNTITNCIITGSDTRGIHIVTNIKDTILKSNRFIDCATTIYDTGIDTIKIDNYGYNYNSLFPFYNQASAPSMVDNTTVWWYDTDDNLMKILVNTYGDTYTFTNGTGGGSDGYLADGNLANGSIWNSNGNSYTANESGLQAAIDDLTSGGTVYLPSGVLDISSVVALDDNIKLVGAGQNVTILKASDSASFVTGLLYIYQKENVTISDLTIDGNKRGSASGVSLYTNDGKNIWIDHVSIHDGSTAGIRFYQSSDIHVSHCYVQVDVATNQAMSLSETNNMIISDITLINPSLQGLDLASCDNSVLSNIIIKDSAYGMKIAGSVSGSDNITLNNFNIYNIGTGEGCRLENCNHIKINNFVISNVDTTNGFTIYNTANDVSISDTTVVDVAGRGVSMVDGLVTNVTLSNIHIENAGGSGILLRGKDLSLTNVDVFNSALYNKIYTGSSNIIINSCRFSYGSDMGLSIDNTNNFKIINCIFEGNTGDGLDTTISACNNYTIIGCTFKNNAQGVDCHSSDDYNIITLNHFIGDTLDDHSATKGVIENNIGDDI